MNGNDLATPAPVSSWWRHISLYWAFWTVVSVCLGMFSVVISGWLYAIPAGITALAFAVLTVMRR